MNEELNVEHTEEIETQETGAQVEEQEQTSVDSDKIVEKLQKRIGKEQAEKNQTKSELDKALQRIEELEKGSKKSVKEKSVEEQLAELQKAKDEEVQSLRKELELSRVTQQADEVLKESGLAVGKDVLSMLVSTDEEQTFSNVKALIGFLNDQQKQWEISRNTGRTPKNVTNAVNTVSQAEFDNMRYAEKAELAQKNPELFKQLTGGI
ncbi:capsid assembly scaffolding protein Gp46 family protein [Enterococcus sp. AZ102]|uniref:capsid assembly scaffolding protein Gp46 family protein n=1 Tax=Enterococcus sp. AZ102 TaxID=2774865 RepID=UPI003F26BAB9